MDSRSPRADVDAGMLYRTQCVNVPEGASGSSQMTATLFDSSGISLHSSGGATFWPSHVYLVGISERLENAAELTRMRLALFLSESVPVIALRAITQEECLSRMIP